MNSARMDREAVLQAEHAVLTAQHRSLDIEIRELQEAGRDMFTLQRLKRQKLALKDKIARLEDQITPDIIA
ncbi:MAG: DUF465 domain-containing protein [Pseudomonadota bacterium]